ncbi:MAG: dicarboxylate/amino acid:cation symporter [Paramuribaculum sp.]|nr:dicarboxylate/amino acid:cation symporter [Paramuribaculum sp.]
MKTMTKLGLLPRIIIAIIIGIAIGYVSPLWLTRLAVTFKGLMGQFLSFLVPLIIIGFVTPAIADIGRKRAGSLLLITIALAYGFTLIAGFTSYFVGDWLFPSMIDRSIASQIVGEASAATATAYVNFSIDPLMSVFTALVTALMMGLGITFIKGRTLREGFDEFREIVSMVINRAVIPLLPPYILCIFMEMTAAGQIGPILTTFFTIILVIFALHIGILLLQFAIAALFNRQNPLRMLRTMMPAYFTALGTQSSAATIPVTLECTTKIGVDKDIAGFTVPLCATIHMSGSTLKIVACALALIIMQGGDYSVATFAQFIAMLGITIVAAPGIPGGAIMASLGLLSAVLGFTDSQNAMMIALYISMDSFGTACNVTGDGAISVIVDRVSKKIGHAA